MGKLAINLREKGCVNFYQTIYGGLTSKIGFCTLFLSKYDVRFYDSAYLLHLVYGYSDQAKLVKWPLEKCPPNALCQSHRKFKSGSIEVIRVGRL